MKKTLLAAAFLAGATLGMQNVSSAHGGQYRGPGDTVPPGGSGGGGGGPKSPGPAGPGSPGPSGPGSPGPAGPGSPGGAPGAGPAAPTTGGGQQGPDLTQWTFWWEFNKEPYLNLKAAVFSGGSKTGSDTWFLGHGQQEQGRDNLAPTEEQIRQKIVPALIEAIEKESNNDIVTGALIALAKIGDANTESGDSEFEAIIASKLSDGVQEIRETAAVSLGILANDASIATLESLLNDAPDGRKLVNSSEVNFRTRSFAAYGLGLIGARTGSEESRSAIVRILVDAMETDDTKSRDLKVACLVAMGLVPLQTIEPAEEPAEGETLAPESSRKGQIEFVMNYLQDDENRYLVRAHAPTTLARLVEGLPAESYEKYKRQIGRDLLERASKRSKEQNEIVQSSILALGLLGDTDAKGEDGIDADIRKAVGAVPKDISDQLARNFSLISMAKIGSRPGQEDDGAKGIEEASKFLQKQISTGKQTMLPWAGLAVGVMSRNLTQNNLAPETVAALSSALRSTLEDEGNPQRLGAYAIAAGIMADAESGPILLDKLDRTSDDTARGYVAVGLGLMGSREAMAPIQTIVEESQYRPELLKQAAISLGLLGDKELVPDLIEMLEQSNSLATQAAISSALGFIGDRRSIDPLVEMLQNQELTDRARGFAAVALGIVAEKELLPWNAKIATDLNYTAATATLNDPNGTGILNIL